MRRNALDYPFLHRQMLLEAQERGDAKEVKELSELTTDQFELWYRTCKEDSNGTESNYQRNQCS